MVCKYFIFPVFPSGNRKVPLARLSKQKTRYDATAKYNTSTRGYRFTRSVNFHSRRLQVTRPELFQTACGIPH